MSLILRDGNYKVTDGFLSLIRVEGGKGHYKDPRLGEMRQIDIEYGQVVRCKLICICMYRVIERIRIQRLGQCELLLGLMRSKKASMCSQDWAQITFR